MNELDSRTKPLSGLAMHRRGCILSALNDGPMTIRMVADRICLHINRTRNYLLQMANEGSIHILKWKPEPGGRQHPVPVFALGPGKNAAKPKRKSGARRQADHMRRVRADQERNDLRLARNRALKHMKKLAKVPATWFSALEVRT